MARFTLKVGSLALAAALTLVATGVTQAQPFPYPYPYPYPGPLVIPGSPWNPQTTLIYPSAFNPGAGIPIPGTQQVFNNYVPGVGFVSGSSWIGADGRPHGVTDITNPMTGGSTKIVYSARTGAGGPGR